MQRTEWIARIMAVWLVLPALAGGPIAADQERILSGRVVDRSGAVAYAEVSLLWKERVVAGTVSDADGRFAVVVPVVLDVDVESAKPEATGWMIVVAAEGHAVHETPLASFEGSAEIELALEERTFRQEIRVTSSLPELETQVNLYGRDLRRRGQQDLAMALRDEAGMSAKRRGGVNLEPEVRGLQETQVALFVDGTRTFAAGPARMDSGISHVSPFSVDRISVIKGPHALSWGSGAMSAVRVDTFRPEFLSDAFKVEGRLHGRYDEVSEGVEAAGGIWGSNDRFRFYLAQSERSGGDYQNGAGAEVPGDYESAETRWLIGFRPREEIQIDYSGGYQKQNDLDFPGRLLDATYFYTRSHALELTWTPGRGRLHELYAQVYSNGKDHRMNNDEKPTARPAPGRKPPFALDVAITTEANTIGGRSWLSFALGSVQLKVGSDFYRLEQNADRTVARRENGFVLFADVVWPDVRLDNLGGYAQLVGSAGRLRYGGTVRVDRFSGQAGRASDFFVAHTRGALDPSKTSLSAALSANYRLGDHWLLNAGLGRVVRSPTALELYSDRFPSTKFQLAAEFMGNPQLDAETSSELDLGVDGSIGPVALSVEGFYRVVDDYITIVADPTLARRLPLSPPVVYRYVNGSEARFYGAEVKLRGVAGDWLYWHAGVDWVRGTDEQFDEPILGVEPRTVRLALGVRAPSKKWWIEAHGRSVDDQRRVATQRFELPTEGYSQVDLRGGVRLAAVLELTCELRNLTDEAFADHLNARNPFTGQRILEPGRSLVVGVDWSF